jgi:hypothetical protein
VTEPPQPATTIAVAASAAANAFRPIGR